MLEPMQSKLQKLGIKPSFNGKYDHATDSDIQAIENKANGKLPLEYCEFLKSYGYSGFFSWVIFPRNDNNNHKIIKTHIGIFLGTSSDYPHTVMDKLITYEDRLPSEIVPITTESGNFLCISVYADKNEYGKIYHWDHNREWDEDEYVARHKTRMPRSAKFSNMTLVAESFTDLINKLEIDPENS
jgi:hypothetical protein